MYTRSTSLTLDLTTSDALLKMGMRRSGSPVSGIIECVVRFSYCIRCISTQMSLRGSHGFRDCRSAQRKTERKCRGLRFQTTMIHYLWSSLICHQQASRAHGLDADSWVLSRIQCRAEAVGSSRVPRRAGYGHSMSITTGCATTAF